MIVKLKAVRMPRIRWWQFSREPYVVVVGMLQGGKHFKVASRRSTRVRRSRPATYYPPVSLYEGPQLDGSVLVMESDQGQHEFAERVSRVVQRVGENLSPTRRAVLTVISRVCEELIDFGDDLVSEFQVCVDKDCRPGVGLWSTVELRSKCAEVDLVVSPGYCLRCVEVVL